jgi:hypothetical protein
MRTGQRITAAGTALAVASLGLTVDNLRRLRTPPAHPPRLGEHVAVLIPARDEAGTIGRCLRAVLRALDRTDPAGHARVLVLDDASSDGTAAEVAAIAARDRRVRLLAGAPPPDGWLPKPWACHQLAAAAGPAATALVFLDADVVLAPDGLAATVAELRQGLDLVSPHPHQLAEGPAERLVQPLLAWSWLSTLPLRLAERSPRPSLGAANGQLLAVDAATYRRAGGHGAVRAAVLDDVALLGAVKRAGGRGAIADGTAVAECRMYTGAGEVREGYEKSLWSVGGSPAGLLAVLGVLVLAHVVPAVAALGGSRVGLLGYGASVVGRGLVAARTGGRRRDAVAHPASIGVLVALTLDSLRRHRTGELRWRGRPVEPDTTAAAA